MKKYSKKLFFKCINRELLCLILVELRIQKMDRID